MLVIILDGIDSGEHSVPSDFGGGGDQLTWENNMISYETKAECANDYAVVSACVHFTTCELVGELLDPKSAKFGATFAQIPSISHKP